MSEPIRAMFERWLEAVNRQDHGAIAAMLHPDYVDEMPQTGERTRGAANLIAIMKYYPHADRLANAMEEARLIGADDQWVMTPSYTVVHVVGAGEVKTVVARIRYPDGSLWHWIVFATLKDGLIHRTTSYYAPEMPAPEWRAQWVERMETRR